MVQRSDRSELWNQAFALIKERGYEYRERPFKLASGEFSHDDIDGKFAIDNGENLRIMSEAFVEIARQQAWDFDAVGGLTMGADALADGIAMGPAALGSPSASSPKAGAGSS